MHQAVAQAMTHRLKLSYNKVDISYYISVIWASKKKNAKGHPVNKQESWDY